METVRKKGAKGGRSGTSTARTEQAGFRKKCEVIFKKADELAVLCGAQIAVITLSPDGKLHTFGSPSVDALIGRYLDQVPAPAPAPPLIDAQLEAPESSRKRRLESLLKKADERPRSLEAPPGIPWPPPLW